MTKKEVLLLIGCIILCELVGAAGSLFTAPNIPGWYAGLAKPGFTPPDWVFAPVWTALYFLMGVSLFLVIRHGLSRTEVKDAAGAFMAQLALNALWTPVFFGLRAPWPGFAVIVVLLLFIAVTTALFRRVSRPAAWLFVPYLLWVGYASALNLAVALLN